MDQERTLAKPGDLVFARPVDLKRERAWKVDVYIFGIMLLNLFDGTIFVLSLEGAKIRCYGPRGVITIPHSTITTEVSSGLQDELKRGRGYKPADAA